MLSVTITIMVILLFLGVPLYLVFLSGSLIALIGFMDVSFGLLAQTMFDSMNSTVLLAVPFFILAGDIMSRSKMTDSLVGFFGAILGKIPGYLGIVTIVSCAFFGAISGSSPAAVATIGRIMHPAMMKSNYGEKFTSALITAAGNLAIIIPPSITMILFCSATSASVGKLFLAGIVPGLILSVIMIIYVLIYAKKNHITADKDYNFGSLRKQGKVAIPTLLMPIVVLGSIYKGICTPTEAAIVAVFYSLLVAFIFTKEFRFHQLWECLKSSVKLTTQIMVIMTSAALFSRVLTLAQVPYQLSLWIETMGFTQIQFLLIGNVVLLIAGMFMDSASAIVALMPLLYPVAKNLGVDFTHFGIVVVLNLAIGMFTPPFGLNLFTTMAMFKTDVKVLARGLVPFFFIFLATLLLVTYVPQLVMWLPNMFY